MRTARNVAIIMVLAFGVAFLPNGGNVVDAIFAAITLGFLAGISWMLYTLSRENQLTLATLSDGRRAIFYGAFGIIALIVLCFRPSLQEDYRSMGDSGDFSGSGYDNDQRYAA